MALTEASRMMAAMLSLAAPDISAGSLPPVGEYLDMYSNTATLYPRQRTLIKCAFADVEHFSAYDRMVVDQWMDSTRNGGEVEFPLDFYERCEWLKRNGYTHFQYVIVAGGRRMGKGLIGGKMLEVLTARLLALGNPQRHYGIDETKTLEARVFAVSYTQAQSALYSDMRDALLLDDYISPSIYSTSNSQQLLKTPADMARESRMRRDAGRSRYSVNAQTSIKLYPSALSSTTARGGASYFMAFDEFAHAPSGESLLSADSAYEAAVPSLAQMGKDGMVYMPSSPWSKGGKFYSLYRMAMELDRQERAVNPTYFAIRVPSWEMYRDWQYTRDKTHPVIGTLDESQDMRSRERSNPTRFWVEFGARWQASENPYLDERKIAQIFEPFPSREDYRNVPRSFGTVGFTYRAHGDAGRSQDNFGFCIGHRENVGGVWHVFLDVLKFWSPKDFPEDSRGVRSIDYTQVFDWMRSAFSRFRVTKFTMDQWNSGYFIDGMRREAAEGNTVERFMSCEVDDHTGAENMRRYEAFKTAVYQGWVHAPMTDDSVPGMEPDPVLGTSLLGNELKFLVESNGKVKNGPGQGFSHFDLADCAVTVVADLLRDQIDAYSHDGLSAVVGAASGGFGSAPGSDDMWRSMQAQGDDAMRALGYY